MDVTVDNFLRLAKRPLLGARILGADPLRPFNKPIMAYCIFIITSATILLFWDIFTGELTVEKISKFVDSLSVLCYAVVKYPLIIKNKNLIKRMIDDIEKYFWSDDKIHTNLLDISKRLQNAFAFLICSGALSYMLRPFITSDLPLQCYIPAFIPYKLFIFLNSTAFAIIVVTTITTEVFLTTMTLLIAVQFQILYKNITEIKMDNLITPEDIDSCKNALKHCIKHHHFILKYVNTFSEMNSINLFLQIFMSEAFICAQLLLISTAAKNFIDVAKWGFLVIIQAFQITLMDVWPADTLTEEASKLMSAIYNLEWYKCKDVSIRKILVIMMQRIQKDVEIWAASFFVVNMQTSTMVFKSAYMLFTFLNTK